MGGTGSASMSGTSSGSSTQSATSADNQSSGNVVIPLKKEELRVGTQQVDAGGVRLRKVVTTETVNQPIQIRKESLVVDRTPANGAQSSATQGQMNAQSNSLSTAFQEGELVVTLREEQPIVQTEIVTSGNVVVRKQVVNQPMNVQRQLRQENIQAEKIGGSTNISIASNVGAGANNQAAGAAPSASGQSQGGASSGITQLNQLTSTADPTAMVGQQVNITNAKVQQTMGDHLVALTGSDGKQIYARTAQPVSGISQGSTVSINGVVRSAASATGLGLDQQSTQMLQNQKVFIDATSVTPTGQ